MLCYHWVGFIDIRLVFYQIISNNASTLLEENKERIKKRFISQFMHVKIRNVVKLNSFQSKVLAPKNFLSFSKHVYYGHN